MKNNERFGSYQDYELYNLETSEYVCSQHINDDYITKFIKQKGKKGKCDYCNKKINVVKLSELLNLILEGINYLYEDPANSRYLNKEGIHGFDGNTFNFVDLWRENYLGIDINDDTLFDDIFNYLNNESLYCERDEYGSDSDFFQDLWSNFKNVVKYKARYVFHFNDIFKNYNFVDPVTILDKVQQSIIKFDLFSEIDEGNILYRCRQHSEEDEVRCAKDLCSAPKKYSKTNGRMNPAGISMFYCSKSKGLTIKEVVDYKNKGKSFYSTGIFRNKKLLRLVDLTKIPEGGSIFDFSRNSDLDTLHFLNRFVDDVITPIEESDTIIDYIPTQIVTEYIRYNPKLNVEGIIYPSSKDKGLKNIVLFFDHEESLENLEFSKKSLITKKI